MIKARGRTGDGDPLMLLGLTGETVTRLVAGEPVLFDGRCVGFEGHVLLIYGRDQGELVAELGRHGLLAPAAELGLDPGAGPPR